MDSRGGVQDWLRRFAWRRSQDVKGSGQIDDALESLAGRLRGIDPETGRQWEALRRTMEQGSTVELRPARRAFVFRPAFSLALGSAVALVGVFLVLQWTSPTVYETAKGKQSTVMLADGSEVVLNNSSELMVSRPLFDRSRKVFLKGEAFFRVEKNGSPFIVSTDVGVVRVLGTEFNVLVRQGLLEVAVLRGSVRVSVERKGVDSSVVVGKDQIVRCTRGSFPQEPTLLKFPAYPGWMHGKFMFSKTRLASACEEIEARFDVTVRIRNPRLQDETITGVVEGQNVDSALTALSRLAGTTYRNEDGVYTLY